MEKKVCYTNEMPPTNACIRVYEAISSCSAELIAKANAENFLPSPDLHYFEISWETRPRFGKYTEYVHRFLFNSYSEAVRAREVFWKKLYSNTDEFVDIYTESRLKKTNKSLLTVHFNRNLMKEWDKKIKEFYK